MKIAERLTQLSTVCAAMVLVGCASDTRYPDQATQQDQLEVLTADEVRRVLTGNTIIGTRDGRRYWVYHPSGAAMWGLESSGDVDAGSWHVQGDLYCRAWRRWHDGRERCWQLAVNALNQLVWLDRSGRAVGASQLQAGNTMGLAATPQQVQAYLDPEVSPDLELDIRELAARPSQVRPLADNGPVDAFGIPLVLLAGAPQGRGEAGAGEPGVLSTADLLGPSIVGGSKLVDRNTIDSGAGAGASGAAAQTDVVGPGGNAAADAGEVPAGLEADSDGAGADLAIGAEVDAGADADGAAVDAGADAGVDAGAGADGVAVDAGADAEADAAAEANGGAADAGADAQVDAEADADAAAADAGADAQVDADADAGGVPVEAAADAEVDADADVDGAAVDAEADAEVDADADADDAAVDAGADAEVDADASGDGVAADAGADVEADADGAAADAGADAEVDVSP